MKLLVPFGSKDNYQSAPFWSDLRIIEEYGYCTITCLNKGGGSVKIGEETIQSGEVSVAEATDVQVFFIPDKGYCLKQVQLENEDVTGQVKNNVLTISKIIENKELTVVFEEDVPVTYTVKVSYNEGGTVKIGEESITSGSSKLVTASTDVTFSIISNTGYHVKSVKLGELDITTLLKDNQFKIESVTENKELTVEFEKNAPVTYTIKVNYNDGGTVKIDNETITNGSSKTAAASSKVTFSIVPNPGYHVKSVKLGDTDVTISLKDNQFTIESISENKELTVVFEQTTYSVKVTYNTGGTIKVNNDAVNSGAVKNVNALTNVMVSIVPNPGFHIKSVKLGTSDVMTLLENNLLHIASITEDKELTVEFEKDALSIYTVKIIYNEGGTVKIGNETIANGSSKTVSASTDITVSIIPNMGYHVKCVKLGTADVTTLLENNQLSIVSISENKELTVVFEEDASITHTVKVTYNEGGIVKIGNESIANGSAKEVAEKEDVTISIIPNTGYHVKSVKLNKMDVTDEVKNNKLIITSIEANQELTITFEVDTPKTYSVKVNYNTGGTVKVNNDAIANGAAKTVNALTDVQVSMIPNDGYLLKQVKLGVADVTDQIVNNVLTIPAIAGDREVSVVFEKGSLVTYSVKVSYSSGGIVKVNNYSVESGTSLTVQKSAKVSVVFIPDHGCYLKQVLSEGKDVTLQVNGNLLEVESVTKDLEIVAIFEKIPMVSCMVDITGNGRVKVNGQTIDQSLETVSVEKGSTVTFSFIPDAKYELGNVLVNNQNVTNKVKNNMYQISTLISDITCQVEFVLIDDPTSIEQVENANKRIYRSAPRRLALSGFKAGVPIYVYDGSGRLVVLKTIRDSVEEVDVPADGLYFVRIGKESFKVIL